MYAKFMLGDSLLIINSSFNLLKSRSNVKKFLIFKSEIRVEKFKFVLNLIND